MLFIFLNPSLPQYVKIGYDDNMDSRLKQPNNSESMNVFIQQHNIGQLSSGYSTPLWYIYNEPSNQ